MNRLDPDKRVKAIAALVEGNSIRAVSRMTGIARNTITDLLVDLGVACAEYQDKVLRNLKCHRIQCDEIWAFCYAKREESSRRQAGEIWLWKRLDLDGAGCGYEADRIVDGRQPRYECCT